MRLFAASLIAAGFACASATCATAARGPAHPLYAVGYASTSALRAAVHTRGEIVRRVPAIHVAEVRARSRRFAATVRRAAGIRFVQSLVPRAPAVEPALLIPPGFGTPYEWQYSAVHEVLVPQSVLRAAAGVSVAVLDTGADLTAPDLAAKSPRTYNLHSATTDVSDTNGHGTFVSSLAAGSVTNGEGIAGFGGDVKLLVVQAGSANGSFTDVDEAAGITYAVDHGAKIINLSIGGPVTSSLEQKAVSYAAAHGVLLVAAAGNSYQAGNPVIYPAALIQPVDSNGQGGVGLAVGASNASGAHAPFSSSGSYLSLAAPGVNVFGALSSLSSPSSWPSTRLAGSSAGEY